MSFYNMHQSYQSTLFILTQRLLELKKQTKNFLIKKRIGYLSIEINELKEILKKIKRYMLKY